MIELGYLARGQSPSDTATSFIQRPIIRLISSIIVLLFIIFSPFIARVRNFISRCKCSTN